MATLEKFRDHPVPVSSHPAYVTPTCGGYSRSEPRILTEDFAHQLAAANRERRAERCPWLAQNLARLSETSLAGQGAGRGLARSAK